MRTIKFRGKSINGDWNYGLLTNMKNNWFISNSAGMPLAYQIRPETIGQFTNRSDVNKVDIYENDLVIINTISDNPRQVIFKNGAIKIKLMGRDVEYYLDQFKDDELEVIGNIHDNPELLK